MKETMELKFINLRCFL